jgi:hypothetical protein
MSESKTYTRTRAGNAGLDKARGKIAGDEKRVMLLLDGTSGTDAMKVDSNVLAGVKE